MNYSIGKKLYIDSCFEELEIFKPGNQNIFTNFSSSKILKFREAAKISSDILCDKNLNLGESIFFFKKMFLRSTWFKLQPRYHIVICTNP